MLLVGNLSRYIHFSSLKEAKKALEMNAVYLAGNQISVELSDRTMGLISCKKND